MAGLFATFLPSLLHFAGVEPQEPDERKLLFILDCASEDSRGDMLGGVQFPGDSARVRLVSLDNVARLRAARNVSRIIITGIARWRGPGSLIGPGRCTCLGRAWDILSAPCNGSD